MLILATYWSAMAYNDWQNDQVSMFTVTIFDGCKKDKHFYKNIQFVYIIIRYFGVCQGLLFFAPYCKLVEEGNTCYFE